MAVSFSSGGLLPNFHHVRGHYPDPPVAQVHIPPAEGDRFRRSRARPEAKVDERVVLAAFTPEPLEDPLPLLSV